MIDIIKTNDIYLFKYVLKEMINSCFESSDITPVLKRYLFGGVGGGSFYNIFHYFPKVQQIIIQEN